MLFCERQAMRLNSSAKAVSMMDAPVLKPILRKIYLFGGVLSAGCFAVTLIWGFDIKNVVGFAIGYAYLCLCYFYFGRVCESAVRCSVKRAAHMMRVCYFLRYGGLFLLCATAALIGYANFTGIVIPQFFPRIILTADRFFGGRRKG